MSTSPPTLNAQHALFLDFDGTLVDIVLTPEAVELTPAVAAAIAAATTTVGGALAIVTGRTLKDISGHLGDIEVATSGSHGMERRLADGRIERPGEAVSEGAARIRSALKARFSEAPDGLLIETKSYSVALHYRRAPQLKTECRQAMQDIVGGEPEWEVLEGDKVLEARPAGASKADAVRAFMAAAPFAGRVPVFIGDDVTDEDGIEAAETLGGFGIKVGPGDSRAAYRLAGPAAVLDYLSGRPI